MSARFLEPPRYAAWRHREAREGFEVVFLSPDGGGRQLEGDTAAVEAAGIAWTVRYVIRTDAAWQTRSAFVTGQSALGGHGLALELDLAGRWHVGGEPAPHLDGCLDVDLESSALTNAFPVQRLGLEIGEEADAPAAWVRAHDLSVERLEQRYLRLENASGRERYRYQAPDLEFECELSYDRYGLVLDYPGIATRAA